MSDDDRNYLLLVRNCDNLLNDSRLSLYEEVETLRREAQKARTKRECGNRLSPKLPDFLRPQPRKQRRNRVIRQVIEELRHSSDPICFRHSGHPGTVTARPPSSSSTRNVSQS
jgi:hypothetical protein